MSSRALMMWKRISLLLKGWFQLRGDTGLRAEVYFVNAKELLLKWGTRQRIMIPTQEVPSGIPVGCNGNLIVEFRDYVQFINKIAGVKSTYSLSDISERIMGELSGKRPAERRAQRPLCQQDRCALNWKISARGGSEHFEHSMAEKVASQSFVQDSLPMAERRREFRGHGRGDGDGPADGAADGGRGSVQTGCSAAAAFQEAGTYVCTGCGKHYASPAKFCMECGKPVVREAQNAPQGDRFCPNCRKMVSGKFCPDCGTQTV